MASSSATGSSSLVASEDGFAYAIRRGGNPAHAYAGSVVNRIQDRRSSRNHGLLADTFRAEWSDRRRIFNQNRFDWRNVSDRGDQVVMQILALAGKEFLHQRHAEALSHTAFDLSFDQRGIDRATYVMRGNNLQHPHRSQFNINGNLRHVSAKSVDCVRAALSVFVERAGGWIESLLGSQNITVLIERQILWTEITLRPVFADRQRARAELDHRIFVRVRAQKNGAPEFLPRHICSFASNKRLSRSRCLAAIGSDRRIARNQIQTIDRGAQRVGTNLSDDGIRSLPNVNRALVKGDSAVTLQANAHRGGVRQRSVSAPVPHTRYADSVANWAATLGIEFDGLGSRCFPLRTQSLKAGPNAHAFSHDLPRDRGSLIVERVQDTKFQRINSQPDREVIVELLLRDSHLRHTKAAKRACRNNIGVDSARESAIVRNRVRPGSMHRNASRNRWPPRGISTSIEISREIQSKQFAILRCSGPASHARRMALGRAHHRLDTRVNHAHRTAQPPRGEREKWLNRQIKFCTEATADRCRNNANCFGGNPQKLRNIGTVHVGRLRARLYFDLIADASGESCFGLDARMLDESGFKLTFYNRFGCGQGLLYIASHHASASQDILHAMRMD